MLEFLVVMMTKTEEKQARAAAASSGGVLASLALCMLLPSLGTSIANVALPSLAEAFAVSFQQVQWVLLAYLLASTSLIVGVGRLGDLLGRRRLLIVGIALFTLASLLCGLAPGLGLLIAARAAQGLGAAILTALGMAFVGEAVPKAKAGRAMGLLGTMSALGTALGPTLGGLLIASLGWPAIFLINLPLGLLALALAWRYLPTARRETAADRGAFDLAGTLMLALTLAAYALAMTLGRGRFFGLLNGLLLLAAVLGAGLFVWVEARATSPLIQWARLRDPLLGRSLAMSALVSTVMMATLVVGPFYLAHALGLVPLWVGLVMSAGPLAAALVGVPAGRMVDRWGARGMSLGGLMGMAGSCLALGLAPGVLGIAGYIVPSVALTAGYALFQAANNTAVMADVGPEQRGVMAGLLNLSRNLGLISGASLMGAIFAFAAGTANFAVATAAAVGLGMRTTFIVATLLLLAALLIAWSGRPLAQPVASRSS